MTITNADRNLATFAQMRLDKLAKCPKVQPYYNEDDELVCPHDGFEIDPSPDGWVHNATEVATMRRIVEEGQR